MPVRMLITALAIVCVGQPAIAQAPPVDDERRAELASAIEERVRQHEERIQALRAQLDALRAGADPDEVRASLGTGTDAPPTDRLLPNGERRRGFDRGRDRGGAPADGRRQQAQGGERTGATPEMIDGVLTMIREENPVFADRLERLREERPEVFRRIVGRMLSEFQHDGDTLAPLTIRVRASEVALRDLAGRVRQNPEERESLEGEVRAALDAAADARIAYERARLERDEHTLDTRRRFLETMESRRSAFIEERLQAIMSGEDLVKIPGRDRRERQRTERTPDDTPEGRPGG
ncbi:MAG: hypothetical protein AAGH64_12735 [Planctomycetota bacterium]